MNPISRLPASTSTRFSLNGLDFAKIFREVLLLAASVLITESPRLLGAHYVYQGVDYTPEVVVLVRIAVEAARRFLTGDAAPQPPAPQPPPAH